MTSRVLEQELMEEISEMYYRIINTSLMAKVKIEKCLLKWQSQILDKRQDRLLEESLRKITTIKETYQERILIILLLIVDSSMLIFQLASNLRISGRTI
jgi:hypothetical protein